MKFIIVTAQASPKDYDSRRFERDADNFCSSLERDLYIPDNSISLLPFGQETIENAQEFQDMLTQEIISVNDEDLCIVYIGHGQRNGWALSGMKNKESLSYRSLRLSLVHHSGKLIFLNSACYGGMGAYAIDAHSGDHLLISPMTPTRAGYAAHFFGNLSRCWMAGSFYWPENFELENPGSSPLIYGNEKLQELFFPKPELRKATRIYVR